MPFARWHVSIVLSLSESIFSIINTIYSYMCAQCLCKKNPIHQTQRFNATLKKFHVHHELMWFIHVDVPSVPTLCAMLTLLLFVCWWLAWQVFFIFMFHPNKKNNFLVELVCSLRDKWQSNWAERISFGRRNKEQPKLSSLFLYLKLMTLFITAIK